MNKEEIQTILDNAIAERVFPGAVVGILGNDGGREIISAGRFEYDVDSHEVQAETVYDVASITKSVPVGLLALQLIEQGRLSLDDRIIDLLPEVTTTGAEVALVRHLLTYSYVLKKTEGFSFERASAQDIFRFLFSGELAFAPGSQYQYSNTPFLLLGLIIERLTGEKLYTLARQNIFEPLAMRRATFAPAEWASVPPTEVTSWRGKVQGVVHDETAYILQRDGFDAGCAGLFASADDILNVAEMVLGDGVFRGVRMFEPRTIALMEENALGAIGAWSGIGWELNTLRFMGEHAHEHMIGKTGFTGTCVVIDPRSMKAFVLLSNATFPKRPPNGDAISAVRRAVADGIFRP